MIDRILKSSQSVICIIVVHRAEEAKRGCKLGTVVIVDLSDFSYDIIFHLPATKIYISALMMLQVCLLLFIMWWFNVKIIKKYIPFKWFSFS